MNNYKSKKLATTSTKHYSYRDLEEYLSEKNKDGLSSKKYSELANHIDICMPCWSTWNRVRWDRAIDSQSIRDLKEYLGDRFIPYYDSSWALAAEWNEKNPKKDDEINQFYKETPNYLYNSTVHFASGDREDFSDSFKVFRKKFGVSSVIDYGCGVSNDGLGFLKFGYKVCFVDFDCPSMDFLRWRLNKRGEKNFSLHYVEDIEKLPEADMFWSYDVLEHLPNPEKVVNMLPDSVKLFVHRSDNDSKAGGRHPFHFKFDSKKFSKKLKEKGFKKVPWKVLEVWVRS